MVKPVDLSSTYKPQSPLIISEDCKIDFLSMTSRPVDGGTEYTTKMAIRLGGPSLNNQIRVITSKIVVAHDPDLVDVRQWILKQVFAEVKRYYEMARAEGGAQKFDEEFKSLANKKITVEFESNPAVQGLLAKVVHGSDINKVHLTEDELTNLALIGSMVTVAPDKAEDQQLIDRIKRMEKKSEEAEKRYTETLTKVDSTKPGAPSFNKKRREARKVLLESRKSQEESKKAALAVRDEISKGGSDTPDAIRRRLKAAKAAKNAPDEEAEKKKLAERLDAIKEQEKKVAAWEAALSGLDEAIAKAQEFVSKP